MGRNGDSLPRAFDEVRFGPERTLNLRPLQPTATQAAKNALATEIEALRGRVLNVANSKNGDEYLFGGTRQNAPPFDPATAASAVTPTTKRFVQIEPGANAVAFGTTAETIFADATATIFTDLTNAVNALRGTGDVTADRAALELGVRAPVTVVVVPFASVTLTPFRKLLANAKLPLASVKLSTKLLPTKFAEISRKYSKYFR